MHADKNGKEGSHGLFRHGICGSVLSFTRWSHLICGVVRRILKAPLLDCSSIGKNQDSTGSQSLKD